MKIQIEGSGSLTLETKNDGTLEIDTNKINTVTLETSRGNFRIYERQGEIELAHKGRIVWSSYNPPRPPDTWKDWGPTIVSTKAKTKVKIAENVPEPPPMSEGTRREMVAEARQWSAEVAEKVASIEAVVTSERTPEKSK